MTSTTQRAGLLPRIDGPDDFAAAFNVSRETLEMIQVYVKLLTQWQPTVNLVGARTLDQVWHRHIADSAQVLDLVPSARTWLDLGSGAGFPGLVIAMLLAGRGDSHVTLIESDSRKCAFLAEVLRQTGLAAAGTVEIKNQRIEIAATQARLTQVEVVTARALAPFDRLFGLSAPFFACDTVGLFLKGRAVAAEIEAARREWQFELELAPSRTDAAGRIAVIRNLQSLTRN